MNKFLKIVLFLCGISTFLYTTTTVMGFFDINFSTYASYMLWTVAIAIFFLILPGKTETVFLP